MSASPVALARRYPPVVLAGPDDLVAAFEASRARPALVMTTDYLREPRPVTDQGVLEEPDVDALGKQLDTLLEEGGRDAVYVVAGWAAAAGFAEAVDGTLVRTEAADQLEGDTAAKLAAALALFTGARKLVYTEALSRWLGIGADASLFDALLHDLLAAGGEGVTTPALVDGAWRTLVAEVAMGAQAGGQRKDVRTDIANETRWLVELLSDLGAATIDADADTVHISPLGVWLLREQLAGDGVTVPLVGELTDAPAGQLLAAVVNYPDGARQAEVAAWIEAAGDKAARELARHAAGTDDDAERQLALDALDSLNLDGLAIFDQDDEFEAWAPAAAAVRELLLDDPVCRPRAIAWLFARDLDANDVAEAGSPEMLLEVLAVELVTSGGDGTAALLAKGRSVPDQVAAMESLWRIENPHTSPVLDAIGRAHPDKAVAKAARKALFKRNSAAL